MVEPLLAAERLRLDVAGRAVVDGLTFATEGSQILLLGAARPLLLALEGAARVRSGALLVAGVPPRRALREGLVALAPLDPPLPPDLTPREYVTWSARLVLGDAKAAREAAHHALEALRLDAVASAPLGRCVPVARRATVVAAAVATGAGVVLLDDPTRGLADEPSRVLGKLTARALEGRRWGLFAARAPLDAPLTLAADEAVVLGADRALAQGPPAELAARERLYAVTLAGGSPALEDALVAAGMLATRGGLDELLVELGEGHTTRDLLEIALAHDAVVLDLSQVAGALA